MESDQGRQQGSSAMNTVATFKAKIRVEITMLKKNGNMYEFSPVGEGVSSEPGTWKEVVGTESRRRGPMISL